MGTYRDEVLGVEVPIIDGGFGGTHSCEYFWRVIALKMVFL